MTDAPLSKDQRAGWCDRCGGPLTTFERGSKLCANCEDEVDYGHDPDLDENGICRVCGKYEPE